MEFKKNPYGDNYILYGKDEKFFISYNPHPVGGISFFQADGGGDETALVHLGDTENKYRILNGDFRKQYAELVELGFDKCLEFYEANKVEFDSSWSTHHRY